MTGHETTPAQTVPNHGSTTTSSMALTAALGDLAHILDRAEDADTWRWRVRQRMVAVRDLLAEEPGSSSDALAARAATQRREQESLLARFSKMGPLVSASTDPEAVAEQLRRLAAEVDRHFQRVHDLAYDEVELELGGSE